MNADTIGPPATAVWNEASNDLRRVGDLSARMDGEEAGTLLRERAVPMEEVEDEANEDAYVLVEAGVRSFRATEDGGVMSPLQ